MHDEQADGNMNTQCDSTGAYTQIRTHLRIFASTCMNMVSMNPKKNIFPCSTYPSPGVYVQCAYLLHVYAGTRTQAYADMQTCLQYTNCSRPDSMLSLHPFVGLDILDHETCSFATILLGPTDVNQLALRCFLQSWSDVQIQKIVFDRFGPIRNSDLAHLGRSLQVLLCSRCTWRVSGSFVSTEYVACLPG
jgi:hypothetical protein